MPRVEDATSRLAVVNCDWEQVRAVDLLAVLRSFVPSGGRLRTLARSVALILTPTLALALALTQNVPSGGSILPPHHSIHSVRVYLSDFGAEQQREEEAHGPRGIYQDEEEEEDEDEEEAEAEGVVRGGKVDNEKLRKYELERYKHY